MSGAASEPGLRWPGWLSLLGCTVNQVRSSPEGALGRLIPIRSQVRETAQVIKAPQVRQKI